MKIRLWEAKFSAYQLLVCSLFLLSTSLLSSCASIQKAALNSIGKMFTQEGPGGNSFTRDDDPILVEQSLPSFIKLVELLRDAAPDSPDLNFGAGQIAVMYAGGFLQPRLMHLKSYSEKKELQNRTKRMYLRGRDSILRGLRQRYQKQGYDNKFASTDWDSFLKLMEEVDIPFLYWGGLSWMGAFALDPFDFEMLADVYRPILLLWRAVQLSPDNGDLHASLITVMGSLPYSQVATAMNHSPELIQPFFNEYYASKNIDPADSAALTAYHFQQALRLSEGSDPSIYVSYANWIRANQKNPDTDKDQFKKYLELALAIDADQHIENRLMILLYQEQAQYLLDHADEYFL